MSKRPQVGARLCCAYEACGRARTGVEPHATKQQHGWLSSNDSDGPRTEWVGTDLCCTTRDVCCKTKQKQRIGLGKLREAGASALARVWFWVKKR